MENQKDNRHSRPPVPPPSPDAFAALHTVEIDRDGHTELKRFGAYMPHPHDPHRMGRPVRPTDSIVNRMKGTYTLRSDIMSARGADPQKCCVMKTLEGCPVPLKTGEPGVYEFKGEGRVRFLGHVREFQEGVPEHLRYKPLD